MASDRTVAQSSAPAPPALTRTHAATPASPGGVFVPPFLGGRASQAPPAQPADSGPRPAPPQPPSAEPMPWELPDTDSAHGFTPAQSGEEQGAAAPPWQSQDEAAAAGFPLDAFIIPADAQRLPTGYQVEHDEAEHIAQRLEELARQVRTRGVAALGTAAADDELTREIAAAVARHVDRAD